MFFPSLSLFFFDFTVTFGKLTRLLYEEILALHSIFRKIKHCF